MKFRAYQDSDLAIVLSVFEKNVPQYFAPKEKDDLVEYLRREKDDYFLMVLNEQLIGCGGINYFPKQRIARVCWDFFDPAYQGKGYGRELLEYRIKLIQEQKEFDKVHVRTSQLAHFFYEKSGFKLNFIKENYWAEGLDLYDMELIFSD